MQSTQSCLTFKLTAILCVFLSGCAVVQRPDSLVCGVVAKSMSLRCYNVKSDFSNDGVMHPGAKPSVIKINSIGDLNGGVYFSPKDFEKVKVWIGDLRDWSKNHCQ